MIGLTTCAVNTAIQGWYGALEKCASIDWSKRRWMCKGLYLHWPITTLSIILMISELLCPQYTTILTTRFLNNIILVGRYLKNRILQCMQYIVSKLGLSNFLTSFWLFDNVLKYSISLWVGKILVIIYAGIMVMLNRLTIIEGL